MVMNDRKMEELAPGIENPHRSMFSHKAWVYVLLGLVVVSVILSTVNIMLHAFDLNESNIPSDEDELDQYCDALLGIDTDTGVVVVD